jgi:hypothetical protein
MRWEDDGAPPRRAPEQSEPRAKPPKTRILEASILMLAVIGVHVLPFCGALGCPLFATESCAKIAVLFSFLSAFMLTDRVFFHHNKTIAKLIARTRPLRTLVIEVIGGVVVLAWLSPVYMAAHGMADVSIAALGVMISLLASAVVSDPPTRMSVGHDLGSVLVVLFAFAWTHTLPHFIIPPHGEEFLGAVTIGSSSLHSLRTVIEVVARCRSR